jgi:hypothetical protein
LEICRDFSRSSQKNELNIASERSHNFWCMVLVRITECRIV